MKSETENELHKLDEEMHKICGWNFDPSRLCWHRGSFWTESPNRYTEGENILEVLEKCAKFDDAIIEITTVRDGSFRVRRSDKSKEQHVVFESTLPLAICHFAKLLFSK